MASNDPFEKERARLWASHEEVPADIEADDGIDTLDGEDFESDSCEELGHNSETEQLDVEESVRQAVQESQNSSTDEITSTNIYISSIKDHYKDQHDVAETNFIEIKAVIGLLFLVGKFKSSRRYLQEFDYQIIYKKARQKTNVDALSRIQLNVYDNESVVNNPSDTVRNIKEYLEQQTKISAQGDDDDTNKPDPSQRKIKVISDIRLHSVNLPHMYNSNETVHNHQADRENTVQRPMTSNSNSTQRYQTPKYIVEELYNTEAQNVFEPSQNTDEYVYEIYAQPEEQVWEQSNRYQGGNIGSTEFKVRNEADSSQIR
ncbi:uncharacterized protein [Euwallacea similis]|uniref:uncharacterized protein n=1 Tax=Euwallacea similis TaxID=1736056 RepID=UPI00344FFFE0